MKKYIVIALTLLLVIAIFLIFKNQPKMKSITENNTWDLFVGEDFKDSNYLQANIAQKNKEDTITVKNINIIDNENNQVVISYDAESIKQADVEGYKVTLEPFYLEIPLGIKVEKGRSYTLEITYMLKNNMYIDKIEFE